MLFDPVEAPKEPSAFLQEAVCVAPKINKKLAQFKVFISLPF
jgi:hypothetical protein